MSNPSPAVQTKTRTTVQTVSADSSHPEKYSANDIRTALKNHFGHADFREGQQRVISRLLAGKSAAAVFPTGGGKSLCYQLPSLMLDGLTLVVSPLIALMKDQIDALTANGIKAARLDSTLDADAYRQIMLELRDGSLRLLYVAPERFNNERFRQSISDIDIALFAVDEAHCISEWGHNFRPDYLKLVQFAKACGAQRVLALTATATKEVMVDICTAFDIEPDCAVNTGFYRSNLQLHATAVGADSRDALLLNKIKTSASGSAIVYVTLQKTAEKVAALLADNGIPARHYHAGLKEEQRTAVQDWFIASDEGIVVATIAFGMGIDKSNIRYVYHYNLPKSLENYSQEIGRAGRDGKLSQCHLLACADDLIPLENFIYGDTPNRSSVDSLVNFVFSQDTDFDISLYDLSRQCDIRPLVLRTLLTQLELKGYISGGTPFYANYQFKPLQTSAEILGRFNEERAQFIGNIFRCATKSRTWFQVDLDTTAQTLNCQRHRLVAALDYLAEQNLLEVKVAGVRNRYTIDRRPKSVDDLAAALSDEADKREEREIARLQSVLDWICLNECQTSALCARFDSPLNADCGHCGWCIEQKPVIPAARSAKSISVGVLQQATALRLEHEDLLSSAKTLSRVLCGLSSPQITKAGLHKSKLFGVAESIPFQQVLKQVSAGVP